MLTVGHAQCREGLAVVGGGVRLALLAAARSLGAAQELLQGVESVLDGKHLAYRPLARPIGTRADHELFRETLSD